MLGALDILIWVGGEFVSFSYTDGLEIGNTNTAKEGGNFHF